MKIFAQNIVILQPFESWKAKGGDAGTSSGKNRSRMWEEGEYAKTEMDERKN